MRYIISTILLVLIATKSFALPAFPGAEGMGAATIGGRGGSVCIVDTLSDNTADGTTFRDCTTASGPRYVVFKVSGIIDLTTNLEVFNPYMTIAGQTSPSGITIVGGEVQIYTHDIIITHMRFRSGEYRCEAEQGDYRRSFEVTGCGYLQNPACSSTSDVQAYNVIVDHCSFSWGPDNVTGVNGNAQDVTFSWSTIAYGSQNGCHQETNHNLGFFVWGSMAGGLPAVPGAKVSLHHSLILGNRFRLPENNGSSFLDSVNNVIIDGDGGYTHFLDNGQGNATANVVGTYRLKGYGENQINRRSIGVKDYDKVITEGHIYITGSLDDYRTTQAADQWSAQRFWMADLLLDVSWKRLTPFSTSGYSGNGIPITPTVIDRIYAGYVANNSGATKCQAGDCQDGVDVMVRSDYARGYGRYIDGSTIDTLEEITPIINYVSLAAAPTDSDSDGMADSWEMTNFGTLTQLPAGDYDSNGYDNIEEYFHALAGNNTGRKYRVRRYVAP